MSFPFTINSFGKLAVDLKEKTIIMAKSCKTVSRLNTVQAMLFD